MNIGAGTPGTIVYKLITAKAQGEVVEVKAAHAAGVATSKVRFVDGRPESVVMMRTGREIMRGNVMIPEKVFKE